MANGGPKRFHALTEDGTVALFLDERHGNHDRQRHAKLVESVQRGFDGCLRIEYIKDGLDEYDVTTTLNERQHLFEVGVVDLIPRRVTGRRVVDVGRCGEGDVGWPDGAGHPCLLAGGSKVRIYGFAGQPSRCQVHVTCTMTQPVLCLSDGGGSEGVGFHNVRTRCKVLGVDVANDIWTGDGEHLVVAFEVDGVVLEWFITKVRFIQPDLLNHGAHGAVDDDDTLV